MTELQGGSYKAFNTIYELYSRRVYAYALQAVKSRHTAEEIVQDVFVNLWKYHERINPDKKLDTLIFTIARRYRINAFRALVNSPVFEDYVEYQNALPHEDASRIEYDEFLRDVHMALLRLPESARRVVYMSRIRSMSNSEISTELNISEKTVRNLLSSGLKLLRSELGKLISIIILIYIMQ